MAEVSDTKTSGTSLISSINQSGSGIDLSNLVTGLVNAETSASQSKLDDKVEAANLQISSYGQLSSRLDTLTTSFTTLETTNSRSAKSASTAVGLTVTNEANASDVNSNITVSSIAKGQVVTFDLTDANFSVADPKVSAGTVTTLSSISTGTIAFVMNGVTSTITIGSGNSTVQGLIDEINKISGAEASTVDTTGSGGLALIVKSETGTKNTFSMTSSNGLEEFNTSGVTSVVAAASSFAGTSSGGASGFTASLSGNNITFSGAVTSAGNVLATIDGVAYTVAATVKSTVALQAAELVTNLNANASFKALYTASNVDGVVTINKPNMLSVAASDAVFTVDGLDVTRSSNKVTDLFSGYTVDINAVSTTAINVTSSVITDDATAKMETFLADINAVREYLTTETKRGLNGATAGSLAGDFAANKILNELRSVTTEPISGYGSSDYYLANLGVSTQRDGTLTLDTNKFEAAIAADPDIVNIVFSSKYSSDNDKFSVSGSENYPPKAGSYTFSFTQSTGEGVINGSSVSSTTNGSGNKVFTSRSGNTKNMYVELLNSTTDVSGTVRYGESLIDKLQSYIKDITSSTGLIKTRTTALTTDLTTFETEQTELDDKIENLTSVYNEKFGSMESLVTQLNKTGEYLQSMMDAWSDAKKIIFIIP
jgi:flagellar hook-associated protein 2